jgi:hypothetical protein
MRTAVVNAVIFGLASFLLLIAIGVQADNLLNLAASQGSASVTYATDHSPTNAHNLKNLTASFGIAYFKMRLLYYTCMASVAISTICSCLTLTRTFKRPG